MKIVAIDNFNRDDVSDILICDNVSDYWAVPIARFLNEEFSGDDAPRFFQIKADDYQLYDGSP